MSAIDAGIATRALEITGVAAIHFLWQGTCVALVLWLWLRAHETVEPAARHGACVAGMLAMVALPIFTAAWYASAAPGGAGALVTSRHLAGVATWVVAIAPHAGVVWLVGALAFHLRLLLHLARAVLVARVGVSPAPALSERVRSLAAMLGTRRPVRVVASVNVVSPALVGWLRPVVLVPRDIVRVLTPRQLDTVLVHELAHVQRNDYLVNVLQGVFEALLFFHPAVWWLSDRLRVEREYACDDVAVRVSGRAMDYARALARLDAHRDAHPALASTGGSLMERITRVITRSPAAATTGAAERTRMLGGAAAAFALCALVVVVGCFRAASAPDDAPVARDAVELATRFGEVGHEIAKYEAEEAAREGHAVVEILGPDGEVSVHELEKVEEGSVPFGPASRAASDRSEMDALKRRVEAHVRVGEFEEARTLVEAWRAHGVSTADAGDLHFEAAPQTESPD